MSISGEPPSHWDEDTQDDNTYDLDDDYEMVKAASFDTIYEGRFEEGFEKFDLIAAKDYLRQYADKLQSERERKKKHVFSNKIIGHRGPHHFEYLYEMGKAKVRSVRSMTTTTPHHLAPSKSEHVPASVTDIIDRLYEKSRTMQRSGKQRREEIDRLRGLSNLFPHERPSISPKIHSLHALRSPQSLVIRETIDRLYGRSKLMQQSGRCRRQEIESKILSKPPRFEFKRSEPSTTTEIEETQLNRSDLRKALSPQEVMDRLYRPSETAQRIGRERREEIKVRSQSQPRMPMNTPTTPSPSPVQTRLCMETPRSGESPSPQEVCNRLYGRSYSGQKMGKERREQIEGRAQSDPRIMLNLRSSQPSVIVQTKHLHTKESHETFSPDELTERLYGRSYCNQQAGKERREEIDRTRALTNVRSPIRLTGSPPSSLAPMRSRTSSVDSRGSDCLSPDVISDRLYGRSVRLQEAGKNRREEVCQMRCSSLPRLNLHCPSPSPEEIVFEPAPSRSISTRDTIDRLYSRSLKHQAAGIERRHEIDKMRELSNPAPQMRVRELSPAPQCRDLDELSATE